MPRPEHPHETLAQLETLNTEGRNPGASRPWWPRTSTAKACTTVHASSTPSPRRRRG